MINLRPHKKEQTHLPDEFSELVALFPPQAIHDSIGRDNTQQMIDSLTSIPKLSAGQMEYLDTLTVLFEAYENENSSIDTNQVSPVEALQFLIEQNDMNASDLGRLLGDRTLGSKILNGQRNLSKDHISKLCRRFNVSSDLFFRVG